MSDSAWIRTNKNSVSGHYNQKMDHRRTIQSIDGCTRAQQNQKRKVEMPIAGQENNSTTRSGAGLARARNSCKGALVLGVCRVPVALPESARAMDKHKNTQIPAVSTHIQKKYVLAASISGLWLGCAATNTNRCGETTVVYEYRAIYQNVSRILHIGRRYYYSVVDLVNRMSTGYLQHVVETCPSTHACA